VLPPTRRQKPSHEKPNGGGYAAAQTFPAIKKRQPFFDLMKGNNLNKKLLITKTTINQQ
jgi:hypothetical protein